MNLTEGLQRRFTEGLQRRFNFAVESKTEQEFYEYVYHYFDYIHKNPVLLQIYENAQKEYSRKHGEIWEKPRYETEEELDVRSEATWKMEHFDMFAISTSLYVRVYLKIDDYKNTSDLDADQDPMAVALIRGINIALKKVLRKYPERAKEYKKQIPKTYKSWYEGQRELYQRELRDFHFIFLAAVENINTDEIIEESKKPTFEFDGKTGDFKYGSVKGNLSLNSQEYLVFKYLFESLNMTAEYLPIIQQYNKKAEPPLKAHKADLYIVIRNIKQKFGILSNGLDKNRDFFLNIRDFGYRLDLKKKSPE